MTNHIEYESQKLKMDVTSIMLTISWIERGSLIFACSKMLSDSVNFRKYFSRIEQIPLRKLKIWTKSQSDNFLIHTKKLLSLATHVMVLNSTHFMTQTFHQYYRIKTLAE